MNAAHFQPNSRLLFSFLFRSEIYDNKVIGFIPSLGTEYLIGAKRNYALKMNLSRNYHQPGLNDLYWFPGGNPDLKRKMDLPVTWLFLLRNVQKNHFFQARLPVTLR